MGTTSPFAPRPYMSIQGLCNKEKSTTTLKWGSGGKESRRKNRGGERAGKKWRKILTGKKLRGKKENTIKKRKWNGK